VIFLVECFHSQSLAGWALSIPYAVPRLERSSRKSWPRTYLRGLLFGALRWRIALGDGAEERALRFRHWYRERGLEHGAPVIPARQARSIAETMSITGATEGIARAAAAAVIARPRAPEPLGRPLVRLAMLRLPRGSPRRGRTHPYQVFLTESSEPGIYNQTRHPRSLRDRLEASRKAGSSTWNRS
jgi:hypothetical protein